MHFFVCFILSILPSAVFSWSSKCYCNIIFSTKCCSVCILCNCAAGHLSSRVFCEYGCMTRLLSASSNSLHLLLQACPILASAIHPGPTLAAVTCSQHLLSGMSSKQQDGQMAQEVHFSFWSYFANPCLLILKSLTRYLQFSLDAGLKCKCKGV